MNKKGYSSPGLFGSMNHYDASGKKIGESRPGLFGSVTTKQIAEALQASEKIKIDKRKMELPDGIRALGFTKVPVKLHHEVTAILNVHVKEAK